MRLLGDGATAEFAHNRRQYVLVRHYRVEELDSLRDCSVIVIPAAERQFYITGIAKARINVM